MGKQYTKCISDTASPIKLCGPVSPLVLNGLGYGAAAVIVALGAMLIALGIAVASGNAAAVAFLIAATVYVVEAAFYGGFMEGMCDQWLNRRLICLNKDDFTNVQDVPNVEEECAMGRVVKSEDVDKSFSNFDLDSFINLQLMPHLKEDDALPANTKNSLFHDEQQGFHFMRRRLKGRGWSDDAGDYRKFLHCEFESDYWKKICQISKILAPLAPVAVALFSPIVEGACNAVLGFLGFLAPIVCKILAPLLAMALLMLLNLALGRLASDPGSSSDANVGERPEDPILMDETVVVRGRFVYDAGHCEGWHEIHPVQKVMRVKVEMYLERKGKKPAPTLTPPVLDWDKLTQTDMDDGLDSQRFFDVSSALKGLFCGEIGKSRDPLVIAAQGADINRWTIHPSVDGCKDGEDTSTSGPIIK